VYAPLAKFFRNGVKIRLRLSGSVAEDRIDEVRSLAAFCAREIRDRTQDAGMEDFAGAAFPEINLRSMSFRVSDHFHL
jgi:hypothetical protein